MGFKHVFGAAILLTNGCALAQTACPQGVAAGSAQCGPSGASMLGNGTTIALPAPRQPQAHWKLTWGAIAFDLDSGATGYASKAPSRRRASKLAVDECKGKGGKECKVTLAYHNQCAVIADPVEKGQFIPGTSIYLGGPTVEKASELALSSCSTSNDGRSCLIVYSNCTEPYLVYD